MIISLLKSVTSNICSRKILVLILLLTAFATLPRLYHLDELGFYGDEETTSFASKSMAEGKNPQMPSGMLYYRALPHTWLNSISAKIFGVQNEYSYRLPSVLFGILTVPLIFLLSRSYVGTSVAFLAALFLTLSEWHIITSRLARMYSPFLFFYIASAFAILRWVKKDTLYSLALAIFLFVVAVSFHELGVFLAFVPLTALFTKHYATTPQYKIVLFSIISGVTAYYFGSIFIDGAYMRFRDLHAISIAAAVADESLFQHLTVTKLQLAQGIAGFLLGIWLAIKSSFEDSHNGREFRILARYSLATLLGGLAATGHLHGAFLSFLLLLLLYPNSLNHYLRRTWVPLIAISTIAALAVILTIHEYGVIAGVKLLLLYPYPNWITLYTLSAGITFLFILSMFYFAARKKTTSDSDIRVLIVIGLFPLILVGMVMKWAAARYLIEAYPFILIISAYALYTPVQKFLNHRFTNAASLALVFVCLIGLSGLLGGHGLVQAYKVSTAIYGDKFNEAAFVFPFYPDHKTPGEYVAAHRSVNDIIIAEDVIQQRWYAGPIDYWLRIYEADTGGIFAYIGKDKKIYDIYVMSVLATDEILDTLSNDKSNRIWLITSGETFNNRDWYLTIYQRKWLERIEATYSPVFTGKDKITKVYCLNCETVN